MEGVEKGKTAKWLRDQQGISEKAKEQLKEFTTKKRSVLVALKDGPLTIEQVAEKTEMALSETVFYMMTLQKYGDVIVDEIDDMDEYFTYKLKK